MKRYRNKSLGSKTQRVNSGITRDLALMGTLAAVAGGCEEEDAEGSQGTSEPNFVSQRSTSPESKLKSRKEQFPQKVYSKQQTNCSLGIIVFPPYTINCASFSFLFTILICEFNKIHIALLESNVTVKP